MKKVIYACLILVPTLALAATNLTEISLSIPKAVKNPALIAAANAAIADAVYWEDEGKEFKQLDPAEDLVITKLYLDKNKVAQKLELQGRAQVGGFGWHRGYQVGTAECTISIEKVNGKWPADGSSAEADCEVTLDRE
ncbi:MAG: hypothetical protein IT288_08810 [Bdellovibrionales bacterium]|nr:hypothetical protein [Bdellovibrionales bacterium]